MWNNTAIEEFDYLENNLMLPAKVENTIILWLRNSIPVYFSYKNAWTCTLEDTDRFNYYNAPKLKIIHIFDIKMGKL